MKRRGFLKRLFGGDDRVDAAFFGIEVVIREHAIPDLRNKLHAVINAPWPNGEPTPDERRMMYRKLALLLKNATPYFDYAYWEYETRRPRAEPDFHKWVGELEQEIAVEVDASEYAEENERVIIEKTYVVVSVAFLTRFPIPIADEYDDHDDASWRRSTIAELLSAMQHFNYDLVVGDAAFVLPGSDDDGLSELDLATERWEHLGMLTD